MAGHKQLDLQYLCCCEESSLRYELDLLDGVIEEFEEYRRGFNQMISGLKNLRHIRIEEIWEWEQYREELERKLCRVKECPPVLEPKKRKRKKDKIEKTETITQMVNKLGKLSANERNKLLAELKSMVKE